MATKLLRKARKHLASHRRECRTFVGYIGLRPDGRPDVEMWPNAEGLRTVHVFTNERQARRVCGDVSLVTVTGVWSRRTRGTVLRGGE